MMSAKPGKPRRPRRATSPATHDGRPVGVTPGQPELSPTTDDTDAGWGEGADFDDHDRWLQQQRPPHWE